MNANEWMSINRRFIDAHANHFVKDAGSIFLAWIKKYGPHANTGRYNWTREIIDKSLKDGMSVLDIGGTIGGFGTYFMAVYGHTFNYVNLEIHSYGNLTPAYFKSFGLPWDGHEVVKLDALKEEPFPFDPETFDMVWWMGWSRPNWLECLLPKVFPILKPGGKFLFSIRDVAREGIDPGRTIEKQRLKDLLTENGFIIDVIFLNRDIEYMVIGRKPK